MRQFSFGDDGARPHLVVTGGVHGDEFEPIAAIRRLSEMLSAEAGNANLQKGRLTLVPCVNEDAFSLGTRCAADGLDLARTCPGRRDGTITEQMAWQLSQLIRSADFYIDLHTGGTEFFIYPLAGYMMHADNGILQAQRQMAHAFGLPIVWGTAANLDGRSLSVARDANVPAIYCEHGGAATCTDDGVQAYVNGCLNVMASLEMISATSPPNPPQYVVEDARDSSGHLQICNPSPVEGYFEPMVRPGQKVAVRTTLGTVISSEDDSRHTISSDEAGIVLMLRTFPRVRAGESVGVVLELGSDK